ncbi:response regulator [Exiguobacterium sp. TDN 0502]|uniref:response regulator n=1 Tax=Exiguobacterium sp. TDN 0502 TaxID=3420731 RepID=UPI003D77CBDB
MRREEMWRLIHQSFEATNQEQEVSSAIEWTEDTIRQSSTNTLFVHTVGTMPDTVNELIEEGWCVRTDISYADVILASEPIIEERIPVVYFNSESTFYGLDNAQEVLPTVLPKALVLDRLARYKRIQQVAEVVVVTEDPHIRRLMERELTDRFERFVTFERAETFLDEYVASRPYLLVFTSALPRADGLELLLRAKQQSVAPFQSMMISMYNRERDHVLAIDRGVDYIMTLPLKIEEFRAWIRKVEDGR